MFAPLKKAKYLFSNQFVKGFFSQMNLYFPVFLKNLLNITLTFPYPVQAWHERVRLQIQTQKIILPNGRNDMMHVFTV